MLLEGILDDLELNTKNNLKNNEIDTRNEVLKIIFSLSKIYMISNNVETIKSVEKNFKNIAKKISNQSKSDNLHILPEIYEEISINILEIVNDFRKDLYPAGTTVSLTSKELTNLRLGDIVKYTAEFREKAKEINYQN